MIKNPLELIFAGVNNFHLIVSDSALFIKDLKNTNFCETAIKIAMKLQCNRNDERVFFHRVSMELMRHPCNYIYYPADMKINC